VGFVSTGVVVAVAVVVVVMVVDSVDAVDATGTGGTNGWSAKVEVEVVVEEEVAAAMSEATS